MEEDKKDKKSTILIVDDDNFMIDMYSLKFKERGFDVHAVLDSKKAIEKLKEGLSPDVILFDIVMPGITGLELLETIKKEKLAEKSIIIALSNQWQDSDVEKAKKLGVDDYYIKANMIPSEVLAKVEKVISDRNNNKN